MWTFGPGLPLRGKPGHPRVGTFDPGLPLRGKPGHPRVGTFAIKLAPRWRRLRAGGATRYIARFLREKEHSIVINDPNASPARAYALAPTEGETLNVVGDQVRVLADASSSGGRCFIFEERTSPGGGPPLHRHGIDDEYFFVLEGDYEFVLEGESILAKPGAFVSAPRGSLHTFRNAGATEGRLLIICAPAGLEVPFREVHRSSSTGVLSPEALGRIFESFSLTFHGPPLSVRDGG